MADATFDGPNQYVTLPSIGAFDTQTNIYSAWKEWVRQGDNAKYYPAFDAVGGDEVGSGQSVAPYFFCRNDLGWRIKMPEANGEITVSGNLFARDPSLPLFEQAQGFDAFLRLTVSTRAVVVEVGTSGLTASESSKLAAIPSNPLLTTDERIETSTADLDAIADAVAAKFRFVDDKVAAQIDTVPTITQELGLNSVQAQQLSDLWQLEGLDPNQPMNVSPIRRSAGSSLVLQIVREGDDVTVYRES